MQFFCSTYLVIMSLIGAASVEQQLVSAATAYYDSILEDKVLNWEITVRRCTVPRSGDVTIIGVRGEELEMTPRGARICWVDAIVDGHERSLPVTLDIKTYEMLPVAVVDIPPRCLISDSLIEWRELESSRLGAADIPTRSVLDDYWSKVHIPRGAIIEYKRLNLIPMVVIGQHVSILLRVGTVEIKAPGKALEDGRLGERIRILNEASGSRLMAVVESAEIVVVE